MAFELRLRRGTTVEHDSFVGKQGELTMDTTKNALFYMTGITPGGNTITSTVGNSIEQDSTLYLSLIMRRILGMKR